MSDLFHSDPYEDHIGRCGIEHHSKARSFSKLIELASGKVVASYHEGMSSKEWDSLVAYAIEEAAKELKSK